MSQKHRRREKRTDYEPLRHFYLGTDAHGDVHHFDRERGVVWTITPDGERTYADQLTVDRVGAYWDYVESVRGEWREIQIPACLFSTPFTDR